MLGYQKQDKQSEKARKFLKWYANQLGVEIQTAESANGEVRIHDRSNGRTFRVDGYIPRDLAGTAKNVVIEYLGCAYHGIPLYCAHKLTHLGHDCLYKNGEEICLNGKTAEANYEWTVERCRLIEQLGFEVRMFWECHVDEMLRTDAEMRLYFDLIPETSCIIDLRDAFMGGRVGPFSLKCDLTEHEGALERFNIYHYDIVSLYPYTNMNCEVIFCLQKIVHNCFSIPLDILQ